MHFCQPKIFGLTKVTHIFKNSSSDYEKIGSKEWEKIIIENLGLTKQDTHKNAMQLLSALIPQLLMLLNTCEIYLLF